MINSKPNWEITFLDSGREPKCPPNPRYPYGMHVDLAGRGPKRTCSGLLPYPAPRCGQYVIRCRRCNTVNLITAAGRPDDVRSVKLACKLLDA